MNSDIEQALKEKRESEFREELRLLLLKYDAELIITDGDRPYGMARPVVRIEMNSVFSDESNDQTTPHTEFNL